MYCIKQLETLLCLTFANVWGRGLRLPLFRLRMNTLHPIFGARANLCLEEYGTIVIASAMRSAEISGSCPLSVWSFTVFLYFEDICMCVCMDYRFKYGQCDWQKPHEVSCR